MSHPLKKRSLFAFVTLALLGGVLAQDETPAPEPEQPKQEEPKEQKQEDQKEKKEEKTPDKAEQQESKTEPAKNFKLILQVNEYRIHDGEKESFVITKSFQLDRWDIERSEKYRKISTKLRPALEKIYKQVNSREPQDALFRNRNGEWIAEQQTGWQVDQDATEKRMLEAILQDKPSAMMVVRRQEPKRSVDKFMERGIRYHFGGGSSSYKGSPSFRVTNVINGASKLHEQYIEKGKEFDFNKTVGAINKANGFVPGYVILGDKLELEDGGGICQVSTTIFRTAYNAGLPITERHQHSHWVRYYDPVGYEATVYNPQKNFKFKNDTGADLFIQASWNKEEQTLRFDLFGVKPDREVKVSDPVLSDYKAPGATKYVPDANVRLGNYRVIDSAMRGVTSVITRQVKYDDGTVKKDTTKSVYRPWGAIYAVNPKDNRVQ